MPRETKASKLARVQQEYALLCEEIPHPKCALDFTTPLELLVATVLSAQCTDKRVNSVTPELFAQYPTAYDYASANPQDIEDIIHPLGFYRAKTQHIIGLGTALVQRFHGEVPHTMEELVTLPGVGRKTANVVLGNAFNTPGLPVDTHVIRVSGRLHWRSGWTKTTADPVKIEQELCALFPPEEWTNVSHRLILHGRAICHARKPDCAHCPLADTCPSAGIFA